jgi:hypothetical protein
MNELLKKGPMKKVQNLYTKGRKLSYNGYRIQAKLTQVILTMKVIKLVNISGTKRGNT